MDKNKTKETEISTLSDKGQSSPTDLASLSFFKHNESCLYVHKKTERLVSALYLLTSLLSDTEPLKTKFRTQGLNLLSQSLILSVNSSTSQTKINDEFTAQILEIISMLEVAKISQLLSLMNHEIISVEFKTLLQVIDDKCLNNHPSTLQSDFFTTSEQFSPSVIASDSAATQDFRFNNSFTKNKLPVSTFIKDNPSNNVLNKMSKTKPIKTFSKPNRSEQILSLMKKDKPMTIKDFATHIKDCSEKTLQRELLSLVAKGQIKKEGERRWSKYSLV